MYGGGYPSLLCVMYIRIFILLELIKTTSERCQQHYFYACEPQLSTYQRACVWEYCYELINSMKAIKHHCAREALCMVTLFGSASRSGSHSELRRCIPDCTNTRASIATKTSTSITAYLTTTSSLWRSEPHTGVAPISSNSGAHHTHTKSKEREAFYRHM